MKVSGCIESPPVFEAPHRSRRTAVVNESKGRPSPQPPQSRTDQEGEVSHEKMRDRTRLLQALHSKDPEAIKQAKADAIKAGYSNAVVGAIGRTPSDVFLFSKLPEAD